MIHHKLLSTNHINVKINVENIVSLMDVSPSLIGNHEVKAKRHMNLLFYCHYLGINACHYGRISASLRRNISFAFAICEFFCDINLKWTDFQKQFRIMLGSKALYYVYYLLFAVFHILAYWRNHI